MAKHLKTGGSRLMMAVGVEPVKEGAELGARILEILSEQPLEPSALIERLMSERASESDAKAAMVDLLGRGLILLGWDRKLNLAKVPV